MIEIIIQSLVLIGVIYFVYKVFKYREDKESATLSNLFEHLEKSQNKYYDSLEKISKRDIAILEKNNKEFLKTFAAVFKKEPVVVESFNKSENTIEKESEAEETNLVDLPRIPIVDGVKIKFEDEDETQTMNIYPAENYSGENPIEK